MSNLPPDPPLKLRLAPRTSAEELLHRSQREQRAAILQREGQLENSLAPFRVGSVPHFNAVPLVRGLESQVTYATPARLAEQLRSQELDAALVSVTEILFNDSYDILDGIAVASLGEVLSVFLAHRQPLEQIREVYCDPASLSSVTLLKVMLAERGICPEFKKLEQTDGGPWPDNFLLISDQALNFLRRPHEHEIWDLGAAWYEANQLPFVYAVWALRRIPNEPLRRQLREARDFGLDTLDYIIDHSPLFDADFRRDYLGWHIHYHLGSDEKRGIQRFLELLRKHGFGPVYEPRYLP